MEKGAAKAPFLAVLSFSFPEISHFMLSDKRQEMRRSVISAGRPGGLIAEITWIVGNLEVICEWCHRTKGEKLYT